MNQLEQIKDRIEKEGKFCFYCQQKKLLHVCVHCEATHKSEENTRGYTRALVKLLEATNNDGELLLTKFQIEELIKQERNSERIRKRTEEKRKKEEQIKAEKKAMEDKKALEEKKASQKKAKKVTKEK